MTEKLTKWMGGYLRAWESNDPDDIRALFTTDAKYFYEPFSTPAEGQDAIVSTWLERADEPGAASFTWKELGETDDLSIITAETRYKGDRNYSNLWVIRFGADDRATEFTEWWMDQSKGS
jgi:hypothetical protein